MGDDGDVGKAIGALADAGVTDFVAADFGSRDDRTRTREFLKTLV